MEIVLIALVILASFSWIISGGFKRSDSPPPSRSPRKKADWNFVRANDGASTRVHITDWASGMDVTKIKRLWAVCGTKIESGAGFALVERPDYETVCLRCLKLDNSETRRLFANIKGSPSPLS